MEISELSLEKPVLLERVPETVLVCDLNSEIADYAEKNLGYSVLSNKLGLQNTEKEQGKKKHEEVNTLAEALREGEIDSYNIDSVKMYQNSVINTE